MDIYLVPLGRRRSELYCEFDDRPAAPIGGTRSIWRLLARRFQDGLAALEAERWRRLSRASASESRSAARRLRDRAFAWLAERVAEQRLLWLLRGQAAVTAYHPDNLSPAEAERSIRHTLRTDGRRHLVWTVVDAAVYLASVPLTPLPGPNVLSLYFSFRAIGHFLSWLGSRHGLREVRWEMVASAPLAELRHLEQLAGAEREALARDVAARLGLRHLDVFAARIALAGA